MITPAEMFGAFNRLATAMVVQEIQAAFSGGDQPTGADQTSSQDAVAPTQTEIQPPVTVSSDPVLATYLATPSAPAGQTLLGLRPPQTESAPASLPTSYLSDASAPALLATSAVLDAAGGSAAPESSAPGSSTPESATPGSSAPGGAATASAGEAETPAAANVAGQTATPQPLAPGAAAGVSSSSSETGQAIAPGSLASGGGASAPSSAVSGVAAPVDADGNVALGVTPVALTGAWQGDSNLEEGGAIVDETPSSSSAKVQISEPEAAPAAGGQTPGRTATSVSNMAASASSPADGVDMAAKVAPPLDGAQTIHASGDAAPAPLSAPASAQRQDAAPIADHDVALAARLNPSGGGAASLQMASAGVIDSFILNAAMIPGWPLQRPFEPLAPEAMGAEQPILQGMDEEELVDYLAGMGANEALSARIRKASDDPVRRRKLLRSLVILIAIVTTIIDAMRAEVEQLISDLRAGQAPGVALAPHSRRRMLLE